MKNRNRIEIDITELIVWGPISTLLAIIVKLLGYSDSDGLLIGLFAYALYKIEMLHKKSVSNNRNHQITPPAKPSPQTWTLPMMLGLIGITRLRMT